MPRRGRPATYEEIREEMSDELAWRKKYLIFNQTSIEGNKIRGRCYTKTTIKKCGKERFDNYTIDRLYATKKEVFRHRLTHSEECT